ncbi:hypothetical protein CK556_02455 [Mesoplasma chauliocola]|uniref:Uncharacterized protein n=1 Tax=Mesoplasma chauliocola TaxID=216427 RepID=A0A249SNG0_9MOLU|nr:hypothetical protein [Mesoplasma chauliocola]ASZ09205.1 hypothetical protein CK556_02455 [Mesoplasma chauliocola]
MKMKIRMKLSALLFIAFIPIFCILIDLIMSVAQTSESAISFDVSFINQIIYFSVWTTLLTSIWGIASVLSYFRKPSNKIAWAESDNVATMVMTYQLIVFFVYTVTFIAYIDDIAGFDTWFKILKSILEHWILPVVIVTYYFLRERTSNLSWKEFLIKKAWINSIIPVFYIFFVGIRGFLILHFPNGETNNIPIFPYRQIDPTKYPVYIWLSGILSFIILPSFISTGLNFASIKAHNKLIVNQKWNKDFDLELRAKF